MKKITKYGHFITLSHSFTAQEVAQVFIDHFYKFHGLPTTIVIDIDEVFTNLFFREVFKMLVVKLLVSFAYLTNNLTTNINVIKLKDGLMFGYLFKMYDNV